MRTLVSLILLFVKMLLTARRVMVHSQSCFRTSKRPGKVRFNGEEEDHLFADLVLNTTCTVTTTSVVPIFMLGN